MLVPTCHLSALEVRQDCELEADSKTLRKEMEGKIKREEGGETRRERDEGFPEEQGTACVASSQNSGFPWISHSVLPLLSYLTLCALLPCPWQGKS